MSRKRPLPRSFVEDLEEAISQNKRDFLKQDEYVPDLHHIVNSAMTAPLGPYVSGSPKRVCHAPVGLGGDGPIDGGAYSSIARHVYRVTNSGSIIAAGGRNGWGDHHGSATQGGGVGVGGGDGETEEDDEYEPEYEEDEDAEEDEDKEDEEDEDEDDEDGTEDGGAPLGHSDPMSWELTDAPILSVDTDMGPTYKDPPGALPTPVLNRSGTDSPLTSLGGNQSGPGQSLNGGSGPAPGPSIPLPAQAVAGPSYQHSGPQIQQPAGVGHPPPTNSHPPPSLPPVQAAPRPSTQPSGPTLNPHPPPPATLPPRPGPGLPPPHQGSPGPSHQAPPSQLPPPPSSGYYTQAASSPTPGSYQQGNPPAAGYPPSTPYPRVPPPPHVYSSTHPNPGMGQPYPPAWPNPVPGPASAATGIVEEFLRYIQYRTVASPAVTDPGLVHNSALIVNLLQSIDRRLHELVQFERWRAGMQGYPPP